MRGSKCAPEAAVALLWGRLPSKVRSPYGAAQNDMMALDIARADLLEGLACELRDLLAMERALDEAERERAA